MEAGRVGMGVASNPGFRTPPSRCRRSARPNRATLIARTVVAGAPKARRPRSQLGLDRASRRRQPMVARSPASRTPWTAVSAMGLCQGSWRFGGVAPPLGQASNAVNRVSPHETVSRKCHAFAEPGGHGRAPEDTTARDVEYRRTLEETPGYRRTRHTAGSGP